MNLNVYQHNDDTESALSPSIPLQGLTVMVRELGRTDVISVNSESV